MDALNEANKEFLIESQENLEQLDQDLVALEKDPTARATIGSIFRTIHTFKGSAGFLGYRRLEALAHAGESLLSRLRDGKLTVNPDTITALLALVDALRDMLVVIEKTGQDGSEDYTELLELLHVLRDGAVVSTPTPAPPPERFDFDDFESSEPEMDTMLVRGGRGTNSLVPQLPAIGDNAPPETPLPEPTLPVPGEPTFVTAGNTIRMDVARLDRLMNLVSELVLARNQILQQVDTQSNPTLAVFSRHLNLITTELQQEVMAARMQPVGNVWSKFPRLVRDLATTCGKKVRLELHGSDTELDKTVLEAIKDPLTHLVRNAVDHGIEMPGTRLAAGKLAEGRLLLRACHESGQVHIEISDDGGGIDPNLVKRKAIERGLLTLDHAEALSEQSAIGLVFLPGFSTAATVSSISGRGVGMDVVKNNVEKIGGTVDLHSTPGVGSTIKLRLPLTLAIIRALIVQCQGQRFALTQASIVELIRLEGDRARGLERIHGVFVHRYRGKLLPLVSLNSVLGLSQSTLLSPREENIPRNEMGPFAGVVNIVVVQAEDQQFGLIVDRILDTQEIVVKPLGKLVRGLPCLAGATIMGDGRVALILDVLGVGERGGITRRISPLLPGVEMTSLTTTRAEGEQLVLLRGSQGERLAIPLGMVVRLEEFSASAIESSGGQLVVPYRGQLLNLINVSRDSEALPKEGKVPVVVCADRDRRLGLIVERIVDVLADPLEVKGRSSRRHVLFTALVQQQLTEVLDVPGMIQAREGVLH